MAFYLYGRVTQNGKEHFRRVRKVKLAGYNSIYNLWKRNKKPINRGWHISADDLIKELTKDKGNKDSHRVIIDFDPNSTWRIGLVEIVDIYVYTSGDPKQGKVWWSPIMMRLRDVYYEEFTSKVSKDRIEDRKKAFDVTRTKNDDIFEFVYLQGDDNGWNWGRVGQVNATFIHKEARGYFKKFFCK